MLSKQEEASMAFHPQTDRAHLTVIWCDRCSRAVNTNDERDHFHAEQCGGCRKFKRVDTDWGWCRNHESVYCGRLMFEHDTCSQWLEGTWA
ncbi:hypothetical protein C5Y96_00265 [Blastopirellula marina]|uniref:Uncharacterized protein n=2 Tax=Pirellulales TaxID=2691354 RepID=A0A2S8GC48_9BACT|nr:hypothetical protein C5Y96_00265 [Blastopirellula marina]RCS56393.1 hypothetical protein DTL36_00265 [Bremerella cremea]